MSDAPAKNTQQPDAAHQLDNPTTDKITYTHTHKHTHTHTHRDVCAQTHAIKMGAAEHLETFAIYMNP